MDVGSNHCGGEHHRSDFILCGWEAELLSLLEVKGLTKSYNGNLAVDRVSFALEERTATALIAEWFRKNDYAVNDRGAIEGIRRFDSTGF